MRPLKVLCSNRRNMNKPRIVVDARMVGPFGHGIGNYVCDMASALQGRELPYSLSFLVAENTPATSPVRQYEHQVSSIPFLHPKEIFLLSGEIAEMKPALYHSPSFSSLWRYPCPQAITVHDLNHLHFAGLFHKVYYQHLLLPAVAGAEAIASVSATAAAEISTWMEKNGVRREIALVPNSIRRVPGTAKAEVLGRRNLVDGSYFLCIANPKPHKNVEFLKRAYRFARAEWTGSHPLPVLVLSIPGEDEEGIRHSGSLPADEIPGLLAGARAFLFPSLYEGFGRPPVEAALEGTLPVCSDLPVLREALAGVREARFLPPSDEGAWRAELHRLASEPRAAIAEESLRWIENSYSLVEVARAADAFYRRALGRGIRE